MVCAGSKLINQVQAAEVTWILGADSALLYMLFLTMCCGS